MIIYSQKIIQFVKDIKHLAKDILSKEIGLKVAGERFYDKREQFSYPLPIVIYNNRSMLGYFDPEFFEIGLHECLMHSSKEQLRNVIRHELAHYMTFINYGDQLAPHGDEFRAFCLRMGWGEEIYKATMCLGDLSQSPLSEESPLFRKIKKLMALATSSNQNEAESAMIKSQQLLLKHNIESTYLESSEEKVSLKRIMQQKTRNSKMRSIAKILETFFVNVIFHSGREHVYLAILGSAVNIEIAEYVANFLDHELDNLWNEARKSHPQLKGLVAKNSFFIGIAKGYCNKIEALKRAYSQDEKQSLMVIEKTLERATAMAYPRLSSISSQRGHCKKSAALGEQAGSKLNIKQGIQQNSSTLGLISGK